MPWSFGIKFGNKKKVEVVTIFFLMLLGQSTLVHKFLNIFCFMHLKSPFSWLSSSLISEALAMIVLIQFQWLLFPCPFHWILFFVILLKLLPRAFPLTLSFQVFHSL